MEMLETAFSGVNTDVEAARVTRAGNEQLGFQTSIQFSLEYWCR